MLDHISIDADAEPFYDAVMEALGHPKVGPGRYGHRDGSMSYLRVGGGVHVAFRAPDHAAVDRFHEAGLANGGADDGAPGERPEYHVGYYAAFLRDPRGNRVEAVCHRPAPATVLARLHDAQQRFYGGEGDDGALRDVLTEDIEWHVPGENAIAGDYLGLDAVLDYMRRRRDHAGATLRLHPGELLSGAGDRVAMLTDGTATIGGVERRWSTVGLYRLRDDRVAACWLLPLDPKAFDDYWR